MEETKKRGRPAVKKKELFVFNVCGAGYGYSYFAGDEVDGKIIRNKEELQNLLDLGIISKR